MEYTQLCVIDCRWLSVIRDHEPLTSGKLVRLCSQELGWKKSKAWISLCATVLCISMEQLHNGDRMRVLDILPDLTVMDRSVGRNS